MTIHVNDQPRAIASDATLTDLLRELGFAERKGIAVAINDEVIPRATWMSRVLTATDHVLVIQATQGG
jgi:sulfur carrier protein